MDSNDLPIETIFQRGNQRILFETQTIPNASQNLDGNQYQINQIYENLNEVKLKSPTLETANYSTLETKQQAQQNNTERLRYHIKNVQKLQKTQDNNNCYQIILQNHFQRLKYYKNRYNISTRQKKSNGFGYSEAQKNGHGSFQTKRLIEDGRFIHYYSCCSLLAQNRKRVSIEPYFISDRDGRFIRKPKHKPFPWSNYLLEKLGVCGKDYIKPNVKKTSEILYCKCNKCNCNKIPLTSLPCGNSIISKNVVDMQEDLDECSIELELMEPDLSPIQKQLIIGLHKIRRNNVPIIWIPGLAQKKMAKKRELFCKTLAQTLCYIYINMDQEIKNYKKKYEASNLLNNKDEDIKIQNTITSASAADNMLSLMSHHLVYNEKETLHLEVIIELLKLVIMKEPNSKGFVIDSFPCTLKEGIMFEAMLTPMTLIIFFTSPLLTSRKVSRAKENEGNEDYFAGEGRESGLHGELPPDYRIPFRDERVKPTYFRRETDKKYMQARQEIHLIAEKYNDRRFVLEHKKIEEEDVELVHAVILNELERKAKQVKDPFPGNESNGEFEVDSTTEQEKIMEEIRIYLIANQSESTGFAIEDFLVNLLIFNDTEETEDQELNQINQINQIQLFENTNGSFDQQCHIDNKENEDDNITIIMPVASKNSEFYTVINDPDDYSEDIKFNLNKEMDSGAKIFDATGLSEDQHPVIEYDHQRDPLLPSHISLIDDEDEDIVKSHLVVDHKSDYTNLLLALKNTNEEEETTSSSGPVVLKNIQDEPVILYHTWRRSK